MDKKSIAVILLAVGLWFGWQKLYWEPYQEQLAEYETYQKKLAQKEQGQTAQKQAQTDISNVNEASNSSFQTSTTENKPLETKPEFKPELTNIQIGKNNLQLSNGPGLFHDWYLASYKTNMEEKNHDVNSSYVTGFFNQLRLSFMDAGFRDVSSQSWVRDANYAEGVVYSNALDSKKLFVRREVRKGKADYVLDVSYNISFKEEIPAFVFLEMYGNPKREHDTGGSIFGEFPDKVELVYWDRTEGREAHIAEGFDETVEKKSGSSWLAINTRYFVMAAIPTAEEHKKTTGVQIQNTRYAGKEAVVGRLAFPTNGQRNINIPVSVYFGPKQLELLEQVTPTLSYAIDFGFLSPISIFLLKMMKAFYSFLGNWGLAIILVTIVVKIVLFPLTYKSMKSMAQLSKLRPQMEKIQAKYKDDKQKLQQEIWAMYKSHGANPVSGCLPMLLQMPVFFAMYRVFLNSMELYQAPFFWWITDLSAQDPYFITPVLLIGTMYLQQVIMPSTVTDPNQQMVMRFMPVMFGGFMLFLPSGLNVYMLCNTVVSVGQQYYLNKKLGITPASPPPKKQSKESKALASSST